MINDYKTVRLLYLQCH